MTIEVGVVLDREHKALHWHLPPNRTSVALPDSRDLWDVLWENRDNLSGFAHSHPGSGWPGPSMTDVTTFSAVEKALGKRLYWWITSADHFVVCRWQGPEPLSYSIARMPEYRPDAWLTELRRLSHF